MPSLASKPCSAPAGLADQDAAHHGLVLRGVLADHEHARRAVQPSAVEDRPPLDAELDRRVDVLPGVLCASVRNGSST